MTNIRKSHELSADAIQFLDNLHEHDLTVNMLLDLKDAWYSLPAPDRVQLLWEEADPEYRD